MSKPVIPPPSKPSAIFSEMFHGLSVGQRSVLVVRWGRFRVGGKTDQIGIERERKFESLTLLRKAPFRIVLDDLNARQATLHHFVLIELKEIGDGRAKRRDHQSCPLVRKALYRSSVSLL